MMTINLLKDENILNHRMRQRLILNDCLNLMWEEFRAIVPCKDAGRIERFIMAKDIALKILAKDVIYDQ